ncbi:MULTISPECIES: hypothetical protein [unclassified Microcoleus]|uniref:hypothetical protein n=1 Tax=unclassified Microcoleus TaxID=2642155 RepID=UPI002FD56F02
MAIIHSAWQQLGPIETVFIEEDFPTSTALKHHKIQEFDRYMEVFHVEAKEPAKLIVASVLRAYLGFLEIDKIWPLDPTEVKLLKVGFQTYADLLLRVFNLPVVQGIEKSDTNCSTADYRGPENMSPLEVWQKSHWVFLVFCQALIVCLKRFVDAVQTGNMDTAKIELQTAADLMWASGAAMKLAGSFSRQIYESEVRPTMTPGNPQSLVESEPLSGIMMWEHDYLVNVIWKKQLSPILPTLPAILEAEYAEFVRAYQQGLSAGHKSVCTKFGGGEIGALTASHLNSNNAVANLEKFEQSRLKLLDPQKHFSGKCPFHQA